MEKGVGETGGGGGWRNEEEGKENRTKLVIRELPTVFAALNSVSCLPKEKKKKTPLKKSKISKGCPKRKMGIRPRIKTAPGGRVTKKKREKERRTKLQTKRTLSGIRKFKTDYVTGLTTLYTKRLGEGWARNKRKA